MIQGQNYMDVKDINLYRMKVPSSRHTNPLEPCYEVMDSSNHKVMIGEIEKSKPPPTPTPEKPDFMNTGDIDGTWPLRFSNKHLIYQREA